MVDSGFGLVVSNEEGDGQESEGEADPFADGEFFPEGEVTDAGEHDQHRGGIEDSDGGEF